MDVDICFNEGSDARLSGLSVSDNPYIARRNSPESFAWISGWRDCSRHWGKQAGPHHHVRPLPPLRRVEAA